MASTEYDVVVYGATPGGIAAAVRCARGGLSVALINWHSHLGGMLTSGLGIYDTNFYGRRSPLVDEIFDRILAHYAAQYGTDSNNFRLCRENRTFEPHVAEAVLTALAKAEQRIEILTPWVVSAVERTVRSVRSVLLQTLDGEANCEVRGRLFIDASYEADLAAAAGVPYRVGRESRAEYAEPHAGKIFTRYEERSVEREKFPFAAANGFLKLRPFDLCTGRIFPGSTGEGDGAVMAYNYRLFLTRNPENRVPVPRPANYSRENYAGILLSETESLGKPYPVKSSWLLNDVRNFKFRNHREIPNGKISWNHGNFPGRNHAYPDADWSERARILAAHRDHEFGLLWFLQNDPEVPEEVKGRARELGLARDEYADNGHVPWEIYVREARRIVGRAVFTEHDCSIGPGIDRAPPHADSIAITDWMMDSHECTTERVPGSAYEGTVLLTELSRPGQIPYRCLLPQGVDNLIVPVCLSASHVAWGAVRVEPTWIQVAEAAATACLLSVETGASPAAIDVAALQRRLVEGGAMITFFNDCDLARSDAGQAAAQFLGAQGFFPSYEARLAEPLDRATAREWIGATCAIATGRHDPMALGRRLWTLRACASERMTGADFARDLDAQIRFHCGRGTAQGEVPPGSISRGLACERLYAALLH